MIDAALIQQCADQSLESAIVEKFIAEAGSDNPLAVSITSGNRVILAPSATTSDEAMILIRRYVGEAVVRVGVTQYPAGFGLKDPSELSPDLVDACANIRMGTALFGKVYRIVAKWYGAPANEAFDDAIIAWKSGYFEGRYVFNEADPDKVDVAVPSLAEDAGSGEGRATPKQEDGGSAQSAATAVNDDPNKAGIRVDLSGVGGAK